MSSTHSTLIGSVVERKPTSHSAPKPFSSGTTGFPPVQHRSKSAFSRNREELRKTKFPRHHDVPLVVPSAPSKSLASSANPDDWRDQISRENEIRVESMTEEEREQERREIVERFGTGVGDLLKKVRDARAKQARRVQESTIPPKEPMVSEESSSVSLDEVPITARERFDREMASRRKSLPSPALSRSSTRPSSRADRRLRFAELSADDVHVYESAPPSPRRKTLALPAPSNDGTAISLGQWHGTLKQEEPAPSLNANPEPEEGSAEYIRRRYFPDAPANDPNLAWMEQSSPDSDSLSSSLRFDLSGTPIPPSVSSTLPTHLGLHHHAEGSHAGYTLDDIFLLSRSSVPAQRATMLGVLARIAQKIAKVVHGQVGEFGELVGKEEELRKRIVAAGIEAMAERGSVGARAIEVIWQCIVGWDEEIMKIGVVELEVPTDAAINSLRLDFFLPHVVTLLSQGEVVVETRSQLLDILHRLAQHSNEMANAITDTPNLVVTIVRTFLLTPIPPKEHSALPKPYALELLISLARASRSNASALLMPADAILLFITILPSADIYPGQLTNSLLTSLLRFYTVLASYGMYSHIASTAMNHFRLLAEYIVSDACTSQRLMVAWTNLLGTWMVCAVDPHQTTPEHDILWSQVIGWRWNEEINDLADRLGVTESEWEVWGGVWRANAAWLEGARVNGVRGGSSERMEYLEVIQGGFENGKQRDVVLGCLDAIRRNLSLLAVVPISRAQLPHLRALANHANTLAAAIRLWLACLPPLSDGPLASPPFPLPFPQISDLCAKVTVHPVWSLLSSNPTTRHGYAYLRPLSGLLGTYLSMSRRIPGISDELWAAQALSILSKSLPGDEEFASQTVADLSDLFTPEWVSSLGVPAPPVIWDRGGMSVIKPFLAHTLRPHRDIYIGPACSTPQSIRVATTQRLPAAAAALSGFGLPVSREWSLTPLDHLLRSGSSEVFRDLPVDWDACEVDIVRMSLFLTRVAREILHHFALADFVLTREEAVFGCMKVFMLENGQAHSDSAEEVFRDPLVGRLMDDLLQPYTISASQAHLPASPVVPSPVHGDLEEVSKTFLGQTPFYQYYTDFVALYDAISFSHPLFARLLLPPTSMRYAVDYRKHLWNDFAHVLKSIRTPVDQIICEDIKEYLWPIETDAQMISFYLRSLLKDTLQGFVQLMALHHVASNIWLDLYDGAGWSEDRASKMLSAVVSQGRHDVVKDVVRYSIPSSGAALDEKARASRLECITRWGLVERLHGLLGNE
ncbi:RNA polymerase II-associated protein rba50 [Hypsizygus marmoreus]|uniref:RNA polymerase II-associated protein rba50 n=1 Tax=Hypsizygus marmoreus TaxID=39966 RepID=A0A369IZV5_HYPMA|nr:RNA polymerase II-associated protein rba50 [Hypsizygus marmoreus]